EDCRAELVCVEYVDENGFDSESAQLICAVGFAGGADDLPAVGYQEAAEGDSYGAGCAGDEDFCAHRKEALNRRAAKSAPECHSPARAALRRRPIRLQALPPKAARRRPYGKSAIHPTCSSRWKARPRRWRRSGSSTRLRRPEARRAAPSRPGNARPAAPATGS